MALTINDTVPEDCATADLVGNLAMRRVYGDGFPTVKLKVDDGLIGLLPKSDAARDAIGDNIVGCEGIELGIPSFEYGKKNTIIRAYVHTAESSCTGGITVFIAGAATNDAQPGLVPYSFTGTPPSFINGAFGYPNEKIPSYKNQTWRIITGHTVPQTVPAEQIVASGPIGTDGTMIGLSIDGTGHPLFEGQNTPGAGGGITINIAYALQISCNGIFDPVP